MKVMIAEKCGFCPGVRNAISIAEKILAQKDHVYCLGPIIHNKDVVEQLAKVGLKTVETIEEIPTRFAESKQEGTVLIRSHGAAPEQIEKIRKKELNIIDATCVLVKRVQQIAMQLEKDGYKVVVIGDKNHPEVQAVVGCCKNVIVISEDSDLRKLSRDSKLGIVCQTTQGPQYFGKMIGAIAKESFGELKVINTLCKEVTKRQESAVRLCKKVDVMFVLGGLKSANTRKLAELCGKYNSQTFHLQNWSEFDKRMVFGRKTAGVTAGSSTPEWIISEFVENLKKI
ncbi:MAG: 4-hydroxy-3-methylbut-2-enyl diphosphate reductase [Planctomycetes bacterium]|nr:4-hydroxy-3-methylbut-2-enyl diphosphate reductase [Planctomycetota bacterium]